MANILTFPISLVLNGQAGTDFGSAIDLDGSEVTGTLPTSKGGTGNTTGTATTNANLTGHVTSVGNAAVLGSFTIAQLSTALSDANISGDNTGDQTNITGNAATVTTNANLTGHVTSTGNAAVLGSFTLAQLNTAVSDADVAQLGANTFTADQTYAENAGIVLDAVLSADGKYSGIVEAGTSSVALAFGELCYRVTATGKWALAKFDAAATCTNELGICVLAAAGADAATTMLKYGKVRADALYDTFTVGSALYGSAATAGKIVSAAPTGTVDFVVLQVGKAEDANTVFFAPSSAPVTIDASSKIKTVSGVAVAAASGGITLGTPVASTSGTSIDFTGITAGAKRITAMLNGTSINSTSRILIQLGDAGGFENTGYISSATNVASNISSTAGFIVTVAADAALTYSGRITFSLENSSSFTWASSGALAVDNGSTSISGGAKSLSAELTQIRFTTVSGTDTFDAGEINISYE